MSPNSKPHRNHALKILSQVEAGQRITQRDLAKRLGIALGLTNHLVRRLVQRGWIEMVRIGPKGVSYLLTPAGVAAKTRQTARYLERTVRLYTRTREVIRHRLETLSREWPPIETGGNGTGEPVVKRIVFYGAGEVAEIAFISLQGTDLRLVGVIDDETPRPAFFGMPVCPSAALSAGRLDGAPFDRVVVMSFHNARRMRQRLEDRGVPAERIFCL